MAHIGQRVLGGSEEQRKRFLEYIAAFNNGDTERFTAFYLPNIVLKLAAKTLNGPAEIAAFYKNMYRTVREELVIHRMIADADGIMIEITAKFSAHADDPTFLVAPLKAGQSVSGRMLVVYRLKDGLIEEIRTVRLAPIDGPHESRTGTT